MKHNSTCLNCQLSALCVIGNVMYQAMTFEEVRRPCVAIKGIPWTRSIADDMRPVPTGCTLPTLGEWMREQQILGGWSGIGTVAGSNEIPE